MIRDFSEEAKERLNREIYNVDKEAWSDITDKIGDLSMQIASWSGVLEIYGDLAGVKKYQKAIIDMKNMTRKELDEIFNDVYMEETRYCSYIARLKVKQNLLKQKIEVLNNSIHPDFSIDSKETIAKKMSLLNSKLEEVNGKIEEDYKKELEKATKKSALKAIKKSFHGIINSAVDIFTAPAKVIEGMITKQPGIIINAGWDLVNDVFDTGSGLVAIIMIPTSMILSYGYHDKNVMESGLTEIEEYLEVDGLAALFKKNSEDGGCDTKFYKSLYKAAENIDTVSKLYELKGDLQDYTNTSEKNMIKKSEMVDEYAKKYRKYQNMYKKYAEQGKIASNIKNMIEYFEMPVEQVVEEVFGTNDKSEIEEKIKEKLVKETKTGGIIFDGTEVVENIKETYKAMEVGGKKIIQMVIDSRESYLII